MAKPAGTIDITDGGWPCYARDDSETKIPFNFMNHLQQPAWAGAADRMYVNLWWQVMVPAATTLSFDPGPSWVSISSPHTVAAATAGLWDEIDGLGDIWPHDQDSFDAYTQYPAAWGTDAQKPHQAPTSFYITSDNGDCEILGVHMEARQNLEYTASSPAGEGSLEHTGRTTDADSWRCYSANEPVSAWMMKRVLAQTLTKILFSSNTSWSVPL